MDRDRLRAWLENPHRTFRWNDPEDREKYEGVETTDGGLKWFRWSHVFREDGVHGEHDVAWQTWEELERDGPLRPMPEEPLAQLRAWIAQHRP